MKKYKKRSVKLVLPLAIIGLLFLSGCVRVDTRGWSHANKEASSVTLYGDIFSPRPAHNFRAFFKYGPVDYGSNWKAYPHISDVVMVTPALKNFACTIHNIDRTQKYYYVAVADCGPGLEKIPAPTSESFLSGAPVIRTRNATNIDLHSATLNGDLYHLGGASRCEVWFEYNGFETAHKTVYSAGEFSIPVDGLTSCKQYTVTAFAKNDVSTEHGSEITFTPGKPNVILTETTEIGINTVTLQGKLQDTGGPASCSVWLEYGTSQHNLDQRSTMLTVSEGEFTVELTNLESCETYYVRAVADNGVCDDESSITTISAGTPIVETDHNGFEDPDSAKLDGELHDMGGTSSCEVWFEYGESKNNLDQISSKQTKHSPDKFDITVQDLKPDTDYYFRAVASNGICTGYGSIQDFQTT